VLEHAGVTVSVVENQEQVDKVLSIAERVPTLRHMVYDEPRGLRDYDRRSSPGSDDTSGFKSGREKLADPARRCVGIIPSQGQGSDLAVILYTSAPPGGRRASCVVRHMVISARNGTCSTTR